MLLAWAAPITSNWGMKDIVHPLTNFDKVLIVWITQTFARCFTLPKVRRDSSYQPPEWVAAEVLFGASVAHNNHKIGVTP